MDRAYSCQELYPVTFGYQVSLKWYLSTLYCCPLMIKAMYAD